MLVQFLLRPCPTGQTNRAAAVISAAAGRGPEASTASLNCHDPSAFPLRFLSDADSSAPGMSHPAIFAALDNVICACTSPAAIFSMNGQLVRS
jgi:threonyl-tRNA synthetase